MTLAVAAGPPGCRRWRPRRWRPGHRGGGGGGGGGPGDDGIGSGSDSFAKLIGDGLIGSSSTSN